MDSARSVFFAEASVLLDRLESALLHLERAPHALVELEEAFRAAHTLKGNAVVVGEIEIEWFAHVVESVLDRVRASTLAVDPHVVSTLLACGDHLRFLIGLGAVGQPVPDFAQEDRARLIGELVPYLGGEALPAAAAERPETHWLLNLRFSHDLLRQGMDPSDFLRYLESLGRIVSLRLDESALPPLADYDPELCYLRFEVELESTADKQAIEDVFACARESCELRIHPPRQRIASYAESLRALPDDELRMGEMLVRVGALTADELAGALRVQRVSSEERAASIGRILVDQGYVPPELVEAAVERQGEIRARLARDSQTLKVPLEGFDHLIDQLGQLAGGLADAAVPRELTGRADAILALAKGLRSVKVEDCFNGLERMVRDLALELGKEVDLVLEGGELSLDRALADALCNAVTQLVRNALDHGIEPPEARLAAGKPRRGRLHLRLAARSDGLLLTLADDGRGIDADALLAAARRLGLVDADVAPARADLLDLVFASGLSTRERAGRYSGRGVGLDAVRETARALGGALSLESESGHGTRFALLLPGAPAPTATPTARRSGA